MDPAGKAGDLEGALKLPSVLGASEGVVLQVRGGRDAGLETCSRSISFCVQVWGLSFRL